jgi:hypothetical protein
MNHIKLSPVCEGLSQFRSGVKDLLPLLKPAYCKSTLETTPSQVDWLLEYLNRILSSLANGQFIADADVKPHGFYCQEDERYPGVPDLRTLTYTHSIAVGDGYVSIGLAFDFYSNRNRFHMDNIQAMHCSVWCVKREEWRPIFTVGISKIDVISDTHH